MAFGTSPFGAGPFGAPSEFADIDIIETINVNMINKQSVVCLMNESLILADSHSLSFVYALIERMQLVTNLSPVAILGALINEALVLKSPVIPVFEILLEDSVTFTALVDGTPVRTVVIIDAMILTGQATNTLSAMAILSDAMAMRDVSRMVTDEVIEDQVAFNHALSVKLSAMEEIISNAVFADSLQGLSIFTVVIDESLALADGVSLKAYYLANLIDSLDFSVSFSFDGEPYYGMVMNTQTKAMSHYSHVDFNSFINVNNKIYAAGDAGLYLIGGKTHDGDPIEAFFRTALTKIATGKEKRQPEAFLGFTSDGRIIVKVIVSTPNEDDFSEKKEYWYEMTATGSAYREGRVKVGRGLKAVYWAHEVNAIDGAAFSIDTIDFRPLILDRRLP